MILLSNSLSVSSLLAKHLSFVETLVFSIHEKLQLLTGIPVYEQRLVYGRKQLQCNQTLSECMITEHAGLHLVGRMRSSCQRKAWQVIDDLVSAICRFCRRESGVSADFVKSKLMEFISMIPRNESIDVGFVDSHLEIFTSSRVSEALVMLYTSQDKLTKDCAKESIQNHINSISFMFPQSISSQCAPIVLGFCKLLRKAVAHNDPLYKLCISGFGKMVKDAHNFHGCSNRVIIALQEMFPDIVEIATKISEGLVSSMESWRNLGPHATTVSAFMGYLYLLKFAVKEQVTFPIPMPSGSELMDQPNRIKFLYIVFDDLLSILMMCLDTIEEWEIEKKKEGAFEQYLVILKELHEISKLYLGGEEYFWTNLRDNKISLCFLIIRYAKWGEDYEWILEHKDLLNFESRRHLVRLLLPRMDQLDPYEMLIDRSQLLVESFEDLAHTEPDSLRAKLAIKFKDEEATGPGVLREWFFLVCQEIFNPKKGLFVACPNDQIRFFPKPASKWDPLHLEYFKFAGRIIVLALMNKIQVGIAFDRSFFMQLAGKDVSLEDIRDADPLLYRSCHQILDMDPLKVDQDVLGLTFIWSFDELGSMTVDELCPGGKNIMVNSRNRTKYVDLLIHHSFVASMAEQITHFARGFSDIVGEERIQKMCFSSLELKDLDGMLYGSEGDISVEDWKAHTDYHGYLQADPQICWFWKIIEGMTAKQRKALLFFWISMKNLPIEGFGGLSLRLNISKSNASINHLPFSHTCLYQICLPAYPSISMMKDRLNLITQNHVCCSFGIN